MSVQTSHAGLFDRLCADPALAVREADALALHAAIAGELARLLNTRSRLDLQTYCAAPRSVIDYGVPDVTSLSPDSGEDLERLQQVVAHAIAQFEPRLLHTRVVASADTGMPGRASLRVDAAVRLGQQLRRVQFDLNATTAAGAG
ncbi:MAG: hypothetical protein RLZZ584_445 [Pseudomonadota bacterium]|jgi:type VI secretion system protein ImpF